MKFRKIKKITPLFIGLGILLIILYLNREFSLEKITQLNYYYLGLAIFIFYLHDIIATLRWDRIIFSLEKKNKIPLRRLLFYFSFGSLTGAFGIQTLSNLGARTISLLAEKISFSKIINSFLIEKTVALINFISLAWISLLYFFKLIPSSIAFLLAIIIILSIYFLFGIKKINYNQIILSINKFFLKIAILFPRLKKRTNWPSNAKKEQININANQIKKIYLLSIFKLLIYSLFIFIILKSLAIEIDFKSVFFSLPIIELSLIFSFTPGALGILDGGWFILLKIIGLSAGNIAIFIISFRIIYYFCLSLNTGINYLIYLTTKKSYSTQHE